MVVQDAMRIVPGWDSAFQITSPVRRFTADLIRHHEDEEIDEDVDEDHQEGKDDGDDGADASMVIRIMRMTCSVLRQYGRQPLQEYFSPESESRSIFGRNPSSSVVSTSRPWLRSW